VPDRKALKQWVGERGLVVALTATYSVLLIAAYRHQISPIYEYVGFSYYSPTSGEWLSAAVLALIPTLLLSARCRTPSDTLVWAFFLLGYIPLCFIPLVTASDYVLLSDRRVLLGLVGWCGAGMSLIILGRRPLSRIGRLRLPRLAKGPSAVALLAAGVLTYGLSLYYFRGFAIAGFDDVDAIRQLMSEGAQAGGALLSYLVLTQSHAINPLLVAVGIDKRRWGILSIGVAGQAFFYAAGGLRAVVMSPILALLTWMAMKDDGRRFGHYALAGLVVVVGLFILLAPATDEGGRAWAVNRLMFWRTFIIPAHTVGIYFDVFSYLPQTHFGHVKGFSFFFDNPYDEPIPFIVARWYYGTPYSANGGIFAEGFASWGVPGILVASVVTTAAFAALDALTADLPLRLVAIAVSFHVINLTNISIFTLLLGSGLGASLLMLGFLSSHLVGGAKVPPTLTANPFAPASP
jgi:hypothetical protein